MTQITLIRHGQANSHAQNEEDYDRLSPLGEQQARWLGEYLRSQSARFDHVVSGALHRHHGTTRAMGHTEYHTDARLNELSYFALAESAERHHGVPFNANSMSFAETAPRVMAHWEADELPDVPERYSEFRDRIMASIGDMCSRGGHHLVITSGGVISLILRETMKLSPAYFAKLMLPIRNSSMHGVEYLHGDLIMTGYNAIPHLEAPDRAHARTFY